MRIKQNKNRILGKQLKAGLVGGCVIVLSMLALTAITAVLADKGAVTAEQYSPIGWGIRCAAFFIGAIISSAMVKEKKLQAAGIAVGIGVFLTVAITVALWNGAFENLLLAVVLCLCSGTAGVLINMVLGKEKRNMKIRYR